MRHLKESWCFLGGGGDSKYVTELLFCRLSLLTARTAMWYSTAGASLRKKMSDLGSVWGHKGAEEANTCKIHPHRNTGLRTLKK